MAMILTSRRRSPWTDQRHLQAILDSLPVGAVVCDTTLTVVYVSPAAGRTLGPVRQAAYDRFGVDVDHLVGVNVARLGPDATAVERLLREPGSLPHRADVEVGGHVLSADVDAVRAADGELVGFVAVLADVTEHRSATTSLTHRAAEVSESSARMTGVSSDLTRSASAVSTQAHDMSAGVDRLLEYMTGVAKGADVIRDATLAVVDSAHSATGSVSDLNQSSTRIGEFTALITSIAEQTKLLALNATIEATRAGAAGTGFAVVAKEVKELAQRSRAATDEIAEVIAAIQSGAEAASAALNTIVDGIDTVGGHQLEVNQIVDQQVAQVDEITAMVGTMVKSVDALAETVANAHETAEAQAGHAGELETAVAAVR